MRTLTLTPEEVSRAAGREPRMKFHIGTLLALALTLLVSLNCLPDIETTSVHLETKNGVMNVHDAHAQYAAWLESSQRLDAACQCCSEELPRGYTL